MMSSRNGWDKIEFMQPQALAYDLDGTLCGPDGTLSDRTRAALRAAHDVGIVQLVATGRPVAMMTAVLDGLDGVFRGAVCENGAHIMEFGDTIHEQRDLHRDAFSLSDAVAVIATLRTSDPGLRFALATELGYFADSGFVERFPIEMTHTFPPLEAANGAVAHKLAVFSDEMAVLDLLRELAPLMPSGLRLSHMGMDAAEIGPAHITKGSALTWWCNFYDIDPKSIWAFGDNLNDHEMFAVAGRSICPANADAPTRAVVDEVCPPNTNDGVAHIIERIIASHR
jgi:Cof subfamily protein (haloacid dehalogenase superfamily)